MSRILGIDLGTSTTCAAVVIDGEPVVIPGIRGSRVTPSYVYVIEDGRILIGENAKSEAIADPYNTIWATKRLIGRRFNDPSVQQCIERLSYKILPSKQGDILVQGRNKLFTPVNVASLILKFATRLAVKHANENFEKAVITVPASFNDLQRKATKMAGENIGLEVVRLVNEPTAAALAWGYHEESDKTIAVYDLGGGTFDVSILAVGKGVYEVLATRGNSWLGGEDFDNRLVAHVAAKFRDQYGINVFNDKMAHQRVKTASEKAKIELSVKETSRMYVPEPCPDVSRVADIDYDITRTEFNGLIEDLVDQTVLTFQDALRDAELDIDEVDNVILVGGMTRVPLVRDKIEAFIGRKSDQSIDPDEAVAKGAAIHAAALAGVEVLLPAAVSTRKKQPPSPPQEPGAEWEPSSERGPGGGRETTLDNTGSVSASEANQEWEDRETPIEMPEAGPEAPEEEKWRPVGKPEEEEAPAEGLETERRSAKAPLLIDVVSQSVGIADMAGLFVPLIKHNSKLPAKVSQVVTTCVDQQMAIRISVYQGEEKYVRDKVMLGEFVLQGIEKAPRGTAQILVTFNIDQSGLFTVSARDLKTNAAKEIRVEGLNL